MAKIKLKTRFLIIFAILVALVGLCMLVRYFSLNEIIIHCSATPQDKEYTLADITDWHRKRGFGTVGYNYIIHLDGTIEKGRSLWLPGAHCYQKGRNYTSIGICYIGGCAKDGKTPKDTRTATQKEAMIKLIKELQIKYPVKTVSGHNKYAQKACPSFDVNTLHFK